MDLHLITIHLIWGNFVKNSSLKNYLTNPTKLRTSDKTAPDALAAF